MKKSTNTLSKILDYVLKYTAGKRIGRTYNLYQFVRHVHIFLKRKPVSKQPALTIKQIVRKCRLKPVTLSISQDVFQSAISQPANIGAQDVPLQRPQDVP